MRDLRHSGRLPADERREQILDVTLDIAIESGFQAITIEAVARMAGITRPVIYGLFNDMPGLLSALITREERRALASLTEAIPKEFTSIDPDDLLIDGVRHFLTAVENIPLTWRFCLLPPDGAPPQLQQRIDANNAILIDRIQTMVEWGIQERGGPVGIDTEMLARLIYIMGQDSARLMLQDPEKYPIDRAVAFARHLTTSLLRDDPVLN